MDKLIESLKEVKENNINKNELLLKILNVFDEDVDIEEKLPFLKTILEGLINDTISIHTNPIYYSVMVILLRFIQDYGVG